MAKSSTHLGVGLYANPSAGLSKAVAFSMILPSFVASIATAGATSSVYTSARSGSSCAQVAEHEHKLTTF